MCYPFVICCSACYWSAASHSCLSVEVHVMSSSGIHTGSHCSTSIFMFVYIFLYLYFFYLSIFHSWPPFNTHVLYVSNLAPISLQTAAEYCMHVCYHTFSPCLVYYYNCIPNEKRPYFFSHFPNLQSMCLLLIMIGNDLLQVFGHNIHRLLGHACMTSSHHNDFT